ncbi:MAG: hypothetical protein EOM66_03345 [Clostridia bacterium]|nr:hypothetical protein [Clostridia bacterium]
MGMLIQYGADVGSIGNVGHVNKLKATPAVIPKDIGMKKRAGKGTNATFQPFQHLYNYYA